MTKSTIETEQSGFDFSSLILGLSSAALSYLGISTEEGQPSPAKNLDLAAQNIEIISMLKEKTSGNLTLEEAKLIDGVLSDLRMKYVELAKIYT